MNLSLPSFVEPVLNVLVQRRICVQRVGRLGRVGIQLVSDMDLHTTWQSRLRQRVSQKGHPKCPEHDVYHTLLCDGEGDGLGADQSRFQDKPGTTVVPVREGSILRAAPE